jgi:hypothetical protein
MSLIFSQSWRVLRSRSSVLYLSMFLRVLFFFARESSFSIHNIHILSQILGPKNFEVYIMFWPDCHVYNGDFYPSLARGYRIQYE